MIEAGSLISTGHH